MEKSEKNNEDKQFFKEGEKDRFNREITRILVLRPERYVIYRSVNRLLIEGINTIPDTSTFQDDFLDAQRLMDDLSEEERIVFFERLAHAIDQALLGNIDIAKKMFDKLITRMSEIIINKKRIAYFLTCMGTSAILLFLGAILIFVEAKWVDYWMFIAMRGGLYGATASALLDYRSPQFNLENSVKTYRNMGFIRAAYGLIAGYVMFLLIKSEFIFALLGKTESGFELAAFFAGCSDVFLARLRNEFDKVNIAEQVGRLMK